MSTQTAAMSNTQTSSVRPGFFRRLAGCALFVFGIAVFLALVHRYQVNLSPSMMTIFAVLAVGLAAGSAPRVSFYGWHAWVRFAVTLTILPLGLITLGFFTNWQIGLGPLDPWLDGSMDTGQLMQLGGALAVAMISFAAWGKSVSGRIEPEAPGSNHRLRRRESGGAQVSVQPTGSVRFLRPLPTPKSNPFLKVKGFAKFRWRTRRGEEEKLVLSQARSRNHSGLGRLFRKRKPNVQVSLFEIHRCPFCLEEVKQNDPRGVKKCEVCNTLHHADCWDVTGECQVPHLNT